MCCVDPKAQLSNRAGRTEKGKTEVGLNKETGRKKNRKHEQEGPEAGPLQQHG